MLVEHETRFYPWFTRSGKLTVAKVLLRMVSGRLFDNHAAIDLARTVFDFGSSGFWHRVSGIEPAKFGRSRAESPRREKNGPIAEQVKCRGRSMICCFRGSKAAAR